MGLSEALTSSFSINLFITCIITFGGMFFLNYIVFTSAPSYGFQAVAGCLFVMTFFLGMFISYYASSNYCDKYKKSLMFKLGLRQGLISVLVYLVVFWIGFFKRPFTDIGGNTLLANTIGEAFFIGMTNIIFMIKTHFQSQVDGCTMSTSEAATAYKSIEKDLNSREVPDATAKIPITA